MKKSRRSKKILEEGEWEKRWRKQGRERRDSNGESERGKIGVEDKDEKKKKDFNGKSEGKHREEDKEGVDR